MSWKQIIVIDTSDRCSTTECVHKTFTKAGTPPDAVMCINKKSVRNRYRLFFSPAAALLASPILAPYSMTDCVAPDPEDTILNPGVEGLR